MNTTKIGNDFERCIYDLLLSEIEAGRFFLSKNFCKVYRKKGYYSKDRGSEIIFDISIEVFLPGSDYYSILVLVECKNYNSTIQVDELEEFYAKVNQVADSNSKAIFVTNSSFQSGALSFAKSKGIGLIRYFGLSDFKWELHRSPSASFHNENIESKNIILNGLIQDGFVSPIYDLYMQSPKRVSNSLWTFFEDLLSGLSTMDGDLSIIFNSTDACLNRIPFIEKETLEQKALERLSEINYIGGEVSLDKICEIERKKNNLRVFTNVDASNNDSSKSILGRIIFEPLEIYIYKKEDHNSGRARFTLAHELAHYFLNHNEYLIGEQCDEDDFSLSQKDIINVVDIARLEFQANYFASSLLMPRKNFIIDFRRITENLNIANKGYGELFVDSQSCNIFNYEYVLKYLMNWYGVSKIAARIRLEGLGLLRDIR